MIPFVAEPILPQIILPEAAPVPPGERAKYQAVIRIDGEDVDEIRRPSFPSDVVERRRSIGEHAVAAAIDDPGVRALTDVVAGQKVWRTWDTHDVEIAVLRQGRVVGVGPVVGVGHKPGRVTFGCWSRDAYPLKAIIGPASRVNLLTAGYFDASLTGWTPAGAVTSASSTVTYRGDYSMRVEAGSGTTSAQFYAAGTTQPNIVHGLVVARWSGGAGWPLDIYEKQVVGRWKHYTRPIGGGTWTPRGELAIQLPDDATEGAWPRIDVPINEEANVDNLFVVEINALAGGTGWIGEVELVRSQNVSGRAGTDKGTLMAALCDYLVEKILPAGVGWSRFVDPVGELLTAGVRYDFADHRDVSAAFDDWAAYGDFWVQLGSHLLRWGQRGQLRPNLGCSWLDLVDPSVTLDAKEAITEIITLADGQDGPAREEAYARRAGALYRLMRAEPGPAPGPAGEGARPARPADPRPGGPGHDRPHRGHRRGGRWPPRIGICRGRGGTRRRAPTGSRCGSTTGRPMTWWSTTRCPRRSRSAA